MFVATWSHDAQNHAQEMERGDDTILGANHAGDEISVMDMDLGDASARDHQLGYQGRRDCTLRRCVEPKSEEQTQMQKERRGVQAAARGRGRRERMWVCRRCKDEDEEMSMGKGRNAATAGTDTGEEEVRSLKPEAMERRWSSSWRRTWTYAGGFPCTTISSLPSAASPGTTHDGDGDLAQGVAGCGAGGGRAREKKRRSGRTCPPSLPTRGRAATSAFLSEQQRRIDKHELSGEGEGGLSGGFPVVNTMRT
ncbi:hypothetical protein B0H13DRAFT_1879215 [Mycena leptocephala]|nr:hypothetical protein B0H13DRAFT_1879215 [Mycena leptocephala]